MKHLLHTFLTALLSSSVIANPLIFLSGSPPAVAGSFSVTDDFNRADGGLGSNWTTRSGSPAIVSNEVSTTSNTDQWAVYSGAAFAADQYAQVTISGSGAGSARYPGLMVRASTSGNMNCYFWNSNLDGNNGIAKFVDNVYSALTSTPAASDTSWTGGDVARLEVVGTTINLRKNGTIVATVTDSTHTSGYPGFHISTTSPIWPCAIDDFAAGDLP